MVYRYFYAVLHTLHPIRRLRLFHKMIWIAYILQCQPMKQSPLNQPLNFYVCAVMIFHIVDSATPYVCHFVDPWCIYVIREYPHVPFYEQLIFYECSVQ